MLPLHGIRVLDLTRLLPGPFCSLMLADLGADVLKIEDTLLGDYLRWGGPTAPQVTATQSVLFMALNRNKRSMTLNLRAKEGREIFARLVDRSDVVLDGFRPGRLDKLGAGYDAMSALNPRIIYCAISGYGQSGPDRHRAGHDLNYLARSGLLDLSGQAGGPPVVPAAQIADMTGAYLAAIGVLAALAGRAGSGRGQFVDISMMDGVMPWLTLVLPRFWHDGTLPPRGETGLGGGLPCYNVYQCADGEWLTLAALEGQFWANFCRMVGHEELIAQHSAMGAEAQPVFAALRDVFRAKTRAEWLAFFAGSDVCIEPVQTLAQAGADRQLRARGMVVEVPVAGAAPRRQIASPFKLSDAGAPRLEPSPEYGEHTAQVLGELGYDGAAVEALRQKKVV